MPSHQIWAQVGRTAEHPFRVLLVDDEPTQRFLVGAILEPPEYVVDFAPSGLEGLAALGRNDYDVVLTDRKMPGMTGDEFCRRVRLDMGLRMQPILMVTGSSSASDVSTGLASGADDLLRKPFHPAELRARVNAAAQRKRYADQLDCTESTLFALARMVEAKDENTGDHCTRLAHKAVVLGQALGLSAAELIALRRGGVLHDIGKLGIPDAILLKPGPLTDAEWEVMRQHTTIGYQLVSQLKSMKLTAPIIRHHHERWDGSGYPDGLSGEQIPLLARVFQIVDIHDALTYARPYKPGMSQTEACEILMQEASKGWRDPEITRCFVDLLCSDPELFSQAESRKHEMMDDLGVELFNCLQVQN